MAAPHGARAASIRIYAEKTIVLFSVTYLEAAPNTARFPALTGYPRQPFHLTFEDMFGRYRFDRFARSRVCSGAFLLRELPHWPEPFRGSDRGFAEGCFTLRSRRPIPFVSRVWIWGYWAEGLGPRNPCGTHRDVQATVCRGLRLRLRERRAGRSRSGD